MPKHARNFVPEDTPVSRNHLNPRAVPAPAEAASSTPRKKHIHAMYLRKLVVPVLSGTFFGDLRAATTVAGDARAYIFRPHCVGTGLALGKNLAAAERRDSSGRKIEDTLSRQIPSLREPSQVEVGGFVTQDRFARYGAIALDTTVDGKLRDESEEIIAHMARTSRGVMPPAPMDLTLVFGHFKETPSPQMLSDTQSIVQRAVPQGSSVRLDVPRIEAMKFWE